jgi:tRNA A58 N-methylase Trm61
MKEELKNPYEMPPPMALIQMITGYWPSRLIYAAAKLGVPDLLKDGPRSVDELAKATGADEQALYRVMRGLASLGVFAETEQRLFTLTPLAELLRSDGPGSLHNMAIMHGEDWEWKTWGDIIHSVKTGEPAFEQVFGKDVFSYLESNSEAASVFDKSMRGVASQVSGAVTAAYDFSGIHKLVDVGGGDGTFLTAILNANPEMQGVVFELPHVIERAREVVKTAELESRCECVKGDFFRSVPRGGDAYILMRIIHDWDDEHATTILKNIHSVMAENGRLLIVETVIPPGNQPFFGKLLDIEMLVLGGGKERTEAEYRALLKAAGFKLTKIIPTESPMSVIEGVPV